MRVRQASADDAEAVFSLLMLMAEEIALSKPAWIKVYNCLFSAMAEGNVFVAIADDGQMAGSIGLVATKWWYSDETFLSDRWTFIHPDFRQSRAIFLLADAAKGRARELGLRLLTGVLGVKKIDKKFNLFRRLFGRPIGTLFLSEE